MKHLLTILFNAIVIGLFLVTLRSDSPSLHFLSGLIIATGILNTFVIQPLLVKNQKLRSDLNQEIYYSDFEWYRKARHERHQKEYEAQFKKLP